MSERKVGPQASRSTAEPVSLSAHDQARIERIARSTTELHPCVWAEFVKHACGDDEALERGVVRRLELRLSS